MPRPDLTVWSGGQTGVDRAALDVALALRIPTGGWVPRGRLAEDGALPTKYAGMRETDTARTDTRTRRNVRDSDATLIVTFGQPTGGTLLTVETAEALRKPHLVLDLRALSPEEAVGQARAWLASLPRPLTLNVAGPRASTTPRAYDTARRLLLSALS